MEISATFVLQHFKCIYVVTAVTMTTTDRYESTLLVPAFANSVYRTKSMTNYFITFLKGLNTR